MIEVYVGLNFGGWALNGRTQGWAAHDLPAQGLERWAHEIGVRHGRPWRKARAELWLSGGLARPFLFGPIAGIKGWHEAEMVVAAAAPELTGLVGPCRVRLEDWPGESATICTAVDAALTDAIESVARSCRIYWRSVRPRWAEALDAALVERPSTALFAVSEEDAFTLLCESAEGSSRSSMAATYPAALDIAEVQATWHRIKMSFGVQDRDAKQLHVLTPGQAGPMTSTACGGGWPPSHGAMA